jgi:hypothetical protein
MADSDDLGHCPSSLAFYCSIPFFAFLFRKNDENSKFGNIDIECGRLRGFGLLKQIPNSYKQSEIGKNILRDNIRERFEPTVVRSKSVESDGRLRVRILQG